MSNELEQLKRIVLDGGYDAESKKQVSDLEDRLHKVLMAEKLGENPVIQEFIKYLTMQSENCSYLLSNERKLDSIERQVLFAKRDICDHFTKLFTGQEKESVELSINQLLTQVKDA